MTMKKSFIQIQQETKDLWEKFHDLETEMIITKTGRWDSLTTED